MQAVQRTMEHSTGESTNKEQQADMTSNTMGSETIKEVESLGQKQTKSATKENQVKRIKRNRGMKKESRKPWGQRPNGKDPTYKDDQKKDNPYQQTGTGKMTKKRK